MREDRHGDARNRRKTCAVADSLVAPFVITFGVLPHPTLNVIALSFTNAPLIGRAVGRLRQLQAASLDQLFFTSLKNNGYFVLLTVIPTTLIALGIALMVNRL